jgi:small subunit ribosomal protein S18
MKRKNIKKTKKNNNSNLMLFQKTTAKFTRDCPLSGKDAPVINYKNFKLLQKYISETGKMLPSRITSVCYAKQKELSNEIKKARILALLPFVAD